MVVLVSTSLTSALPRLFWSYHNSLLWYYNFFDTIVIVLVWTSLTTSPRWASTSIWSFNSWPPTWRTPTSSSSFQSFESSDCSSWPDTPLDSRSWSRPSEPQPKNWCCSFSSSFLESLSSRHLFTTLKEFKWDDFLLTIQICWLSRYRCFHRLFAADKR